MAGHPDQLATRHHKPGTLEAAPAVPSARPRPNEGTHVPSSLLLEKLTSPQVMSQASRALDSAWAAWSLHRKPRTSGAVLRRALVSAGLTQGATFAASQSGRAQLAHQALVEPLDGFRGPVGDVPVRISPTWEAGPTVTEFNGKLVMVVGPDYEKLDRAAQEELYRTTLHAWVPPRTALALGLGAAVSRAALHRGIIGRRGKVSKGRSAALAAVMTAAELGLYAAARRFTTQRRQARVAAERVTTPASTPPA